MTDVTMEERELDIDWSKYGRAPNGETSAALRLIDRIDRLIEVLERPNAKETLWSSEQIASWLGLSKQTVELRVVTRPGFPSALRPVDSKQAQRRWFANDVMEWARSTAGTIPASRPGRRRKTA
ncbi:hypothetical protein [Paraburkholderia terrae]